MRIVIDLQGAQGSNMRRGIGRYAISLTKAIIENCGEHEILVTLNGLIPDTIDFLRIQLDGTLPNKNIHVWNASGPVCSIDESNYSRRKVAELCREAFIASLKPDIVLLTSLFEGLSDNAVTSVGTFCNSVPTAIILYDLIPLIHRSHYLEDGRVEEWYENKLDHLRRADVLLSISESSRQEALSYLECPVDGVVNISTAVDSRFTPMKIESSVEERVRDRYSLKRPFVMCTGGIDYRKNIEGLIRAYAKLPEKIRGKHQLAIICSIEPNDKLRLETLAENNNLNQNDVIFTNFVPDEDLLVMYGICELFVFPSWHEGFGLPVLEALACGCVAIGSNVSSIPEVLGLDDALFDPMCDDSISSKMLQALTDETFREKLIKHSQSQANKFSWKMTSTLALSALRESVETFNNKNSKSSVVRTRPTLAFISPLPPARSGIADYSAELLPELSRHYEIEIIANQVEIINPWIKANCKVRSVEWFRENSDYYDRILYHFGNSEFHQHMFELLKKNAGVVVLHDFYLSGVSAHMEVTGHTSNFWAQELYISHGYHALSNRFTASDTADVVWKYPCSLSVLQSGVGTIVHSQYSLKLAEKWYSETPVETSVIPLLRGGNIQVDKAFARESLGFKVGDFLVCAFGMIGPNKLNHRLLHAWLDSSLAKDKSCHLIFVGENHTGDYGDQLIHTINQSKLEARIRITGWADASEFRQFLAAADIGVQLRTLSRGETSAAVLDCMNYGLPLIVNANGSMSELDPEAAWMLKDNFDDEQLIDALEKMRVDNILRDRMSAIARANILENHSPRKCAAQYRDAIEKSYLARTFGRVGLSQAIVKSFETPPKDEDLILMAENIAINLPVRPRKAQLFVDISELVQRDAKSGIQRVVRSVLQMWLRSPPAGFRIEPVYATLDNSYRYARSFIQEFLEVPDSILHDEAIEYSSGDIFIGLDFQPHVVKAHREFYKKLRLNGVQVKFVLYDLLCIKLPHFFVGGAESDFTDWLDVVAENGGAVCISKSVANELNDWLNSNRHSLHRSFTVDWFHLGADVDSSAPTKGVPANAEKVLETLRNRISFLVVGTIEPRKGHVQLLDAFENLWQNDIDCNLVIVGKRGWLAEELVGRIKSHSEVDKRLHWLDGISDEYLELIYARSSCLVAASFGEGFGLPLIEAAQHKLPIFARDIPVFREVAGEHAFYFQAPTSELLSLAIREWLSLFNEGCHPKSKDMPWYTWKESSDELLNLITE